MIISWKKSSNLSFIWIVSEFPNYTLFPAASSNALTRKHYRSQEYNTSESIVGDTLASAKPYSKTHKSTLRINRCVSPLSSPCKSKLYMYCPIITLVVSQPATVLRLYSGQPLETKAWQQNTEDGNAPLYHKKPESLPFPGLKDTILSVPRTIH